MSHSSEPMQPSEDAGRASNNAFSADAHYTGALPLSIFNESEIPDCLPVTTSSMTGDPDADASGSQRQCYPLSLGMDSPLGRYGH